MADKIVTDNPKKWESWNPYQGVVGGLVGAVVGGPVGAVVGGPVSDVVGGGAKGIGDTAATDRAVDASGATALSAQTYQLSASLANNTGLSIEEVYRRAILLFAAAQEAESSGNKLAILDSDNNTLAEIKASQ